MTSGFAFDIPAWLLRPRLWLLIAACAVLCPLILMRPAWKLQDFDQNFYITLAYDLDRSGVFSNGSFSEADSTLTTPPAGMFFGPVFPSLVYAAMKLDPRFAAAVKCSVEADRGYRDETTCEAYAVPIRILNAFLLALGVVAVASAAQLIFAQRWIFLLTGILATAALAFEADIFSYIMTESAIFSIYSLFAWAMVLAWRTGKVWHFVLGGLLLGLLSLTKPAFPILFPAVVGLSLLYRYRGGDAKRFNIGRAMLAFSIAFACVVGGWVVRNAVSVGKLGFTEEYGAAALIERFAYNDMTPREFFQAFPYCTPGLGDLAFDLTYGTDSMHRFVYHTKDSFFHIGRGRRNALVDKYGRLDPLIVGIAGQELSGGWWRHLLISIPLAWCGMWAGWLASLLLIPLFAWACIRALRSGQPLLLLYAAPAVVMLGLDALIGNHYTRYNLILIGPYAVGAAWIMASWLPRPRGIVGARPSLIR